MPATSTSARTCAADLDRSHAPRGNAALAGSLLLAEAISLRLLLAALAVLGGIGLILRARVSKV